MNEPVDILSEEAHRGLFDLPRETILRVDHADIAVVAGAHPVEERFAEPIETNWQSEIASNDKLFDGRFCLMQSIRLGPDNHLRAVCHMGRFATFAYWRRHQPFGLEHLFAHAVPVLTDGSLLAVHMAPHNLTGGLTYFAAGSFDAHDVEGGHVSVGGNMRREVLEETGIDLAEGSAEKNYWLWSGENRQNCLFQRYHLPFGAEEAIDRVRSSIAAQEQPELAGALIIRSADDATASMPPHMEPFLRFHFGD